MNNKKVYTVIGFIAVMLLIWVLSNSNKENSSSSEKIKVVLRKVGHQLLLAKKDSTSLVLPVVKLNHSNYQISFQKNLSIKPNDLVTIIKDNFKKETLSSHYLVEVLDCNTNETVYSYEIKNTKESNIIPCVGRALNENCYTIKIYFLDKIDPTKKFPFPFMLYIITILLFSSLFYFFKRGRKILSPTITSSEAHKSIGIFKFYPDQNKLVKETDEINLSKKECEILAIFIEKPNQIIKREELMKRVWEDNGIIVGRSLDTYISKLRKKLKEDNSIKITNVHGVGYKLEISD